MQELDIHFFVWNEEKFSTTVHLQTKLWKKQ